MGAYQPGYLKQRNRKLVFDLLAKHRELSRADIARLSGMSFPTASKTVDYMLSRKVVSEADQPDARDSGPGRRGKRLRFNPDAFHAIGIEFEGSFAEVGRVNLNGDILESEGMRFSSFDDVGEMTKLAKRVASMCRDKPILGIGIGFPGVANPESRQLIAPRLFPNGGSATFDELFAPLTEATGLPLFVDNDVNAACAGEVYLRRDDPGDTDLAYLSLGTGLGVGISLGGKLWRGSGYEAGEIGRIITNATQGGTRNALEDSINIRAINAALGLRLEETDELSAGQRAAIIGMLTPYMAVVIFNFITIMDIHTIVLSGYIPRLVGEGLHEALEENVAGLLSRFSRAVSILPPRSPSSVVVGGASMVFAKSIFDAMLDTAHESAEALSCDGKSGGSNVRP